MSWVPRFTLGRNAISEPLPLSGLNASSRGWGSFSVGLCPAYLKKWQEPEQQQHHHSEGSKQLEPLSGSPRRWGITPDKLRAAGPSTPPQQKVEHLCEENEQCVGLPKLHKNLETIVEEELEKEEREKGTFDILEEKLDRVVVAVSKDQSSKDALKWTIVNLVPSHGVVRLLYVCPPVKTVRTTGGKVRPLKPASRKVATDDLQDAQLKTEELLQDHQWLCDLNKVEAEFVMVESSKTVQKVLVEQVSKLGITRLVLGTSQRNVFSRKIRGPGIPVYVSKNAPMFCTVMIVNKCKLVSVREGFGVFPPISPGVFSDMATTNATYTGASAGASATGAVEELEVDLLTARLSTPRMGLPLELELGNRHVSGLLSLPIHPTHGMNPASNSTILSTKTESEKVLGGPKGSHPSLPAFFNPLSQTPYDNDECFSFETDGKLRAIGSTWELPIRNQAGMLQGIVGLSSGNPSGIQPKSNAHSADDNLLTPSPTSSENSDLEDMHVLSVGIDGQGRIISNYQEERSYTEMPLEAGLTGEALEVDTPLDCPTSILGANNVGPVAKAGDKVICTVASPEFPGKEISGPEKMAISEISKHKQIEKQGAPVLTTFAGLVEDCWDKTGSSSSDSSTPAQHHAHETINEVETLRMQLEQACMSMEKAQCYAENQALRCLEAEKAATNARRKMERFAAQQKVESKLRIEALRVAEIARQLAKEEAKLRDEALAAVVKARKAVQEETECRKEAEAKACREAESNRMAMAALQQAQYREYNFEELQAASNNFAAELKIGEGAFGIVYKGKLQHTNVAIKVLTSDMLEDNREFQYQVERLGHTHHPHMVMVLGCCLEKRCLVYEFMANGSLEDRLLCKGDTPPLLWHTRFCIAAEVASALLFLHSSKPEPIVHQNLKPANIFLDRNFVSKLGDVRHTKLLTKRALGSAALSSVYFQDSMSGSTFAYIDPEFQRTGSLGPKSDIYAFGIVILQLLTGKPPVGVYELVEAAVSDGCLEEVLDPTAGKWPSQEAKEVAGLALQCAEMRRRNRPDLETTVLAKLDRIRAFVKKMRLRMCEEGHRVPMPSVCEGDRVALPTHFLSSTFKVL